MFRFRRGKYLHYIFPVMQYNVCGHAVGGVGYIFTEGPVIV
jgi:hypothetical protein